MLKVIKKEPLPGNEIAPPLEMGKEYELKKVYTCKCGQKHYDVGLISQVNWVTCHSCREVLPGSDLIHWCHPSRFEEVVTGEELGGLLFSIHTHGELCNKDEIVYKEKDIVQLLAKLGFPEPVWGKIIDFKLWVPEVTDTLGEDEGGLG